MVGLGCEFPVKPERANVRSTLVADAMLDKSRVRNGHEILGGFAVGSPKGEGVFTDRSLGSKSNALWDNRIAHKNQPFRTGNSRKCELRSLLTGSRGFDRATSAAHP